MRFVRDLDAIVKKESFIAQDHREILHDFTKIIGGAYNVSSDDELRFNPDGTSSQLTIDESSSAVRSLLDIGFYLRHVAKPGDLLMVDEPELSLHPENQRRVARLFARLVTAGIKVLITTHSDYIVRELNLLIMLRNDAPHLKQIAQKEEYSAEELIDAEKIRVYIAENGALTPADIDPELGIEARSFDETINAMNRIQDAIFWEEDGQDDDDQ